MKISPTSVISLSQRQYNDNIKQVKDIFTSFNSLRNGLTNNATKGMASKKDIH